MQTDCAKCGKTIQYDGRKDARPKYCDECRNLTCESCGTKFKVSNIQVEFGRRFCSRECFAAVRGTRFDSSIARESPRGRMPYLLKTAVLDWASGRCEKCGYRDSGETKRSGLAVHHILNHTDEVDNLSCLCEACHSEIHAFMVSTKMPFYIWLKLPDLQILATTFEGLSRLPDSLKDEMTVAQWERLVRGLHEWRLSDDYDWDKGIGGNPLPSGLLSPWLTYGDDFTINDFTIE